MGCTREGSLDQSSWEPIGLEYFLQVFHLCLLAGGIAYLEGSVSHASYHSGEDPWVMVVVVWNAPICVCRFAVHVGGELVFISGYK